MFRFLAGTLYILSDGDTSLVPAQCVPCQNGILSPRNLAFLAWALYTFGLGVLPAKSSLNAFELVFPASGAHTHTHTHSKPFSISNPAWSCFNA